MTSPATPVLSNPGLTAAIFAAVASATIAAGPAKADTNATSVDAYVEIDQVNLGDVWADMDVHLTDPAKEIVSTSTAVGNSGTALVTSGNVNVDVKQDQSGTVSASNIISAPSARQAIATTTAYGNSATGGTGSGNLAYRAEQTSDGLVEATTVLEMGRVGKAVTATTAIANVSVPTATYGDSAAFQIQESNGSVQAETDIDIERARKSASFVTNAGGNAVSSTGWTSTAINGAVQTTAAGERIVGTTNVEIDRAKDVLAATTTFGNSITLHNEWGYTSLGREGSEVFQGNDSEIAAETYVTLDHWRGTATSSAYGVGNVASVSNIGSDTDLYVIQNNYGDVYSTATLDGSSNRHGQAVLNSTAIGNAASATLCNICGDSAIGGQATQYNQGNVVAQGAATIGQAGGVYGTATAVGNSATYQSTGH